MEREISSVSMLAVVLISLAFIVTIAFGVFSLGKESANDGTVITQERVETVEASEFLQYDQTIVSGLTVKNTLVNFEGRQLALLVATQAFTDLNKATENVTSSVLGLNDDRFYAVRQLSKNPLGAVDSGIYTNVGQAYENNTDLARTLVLASGCVGYEPVGSTNIYLDTTSAGVSVIGAFINYNALLKDGGNVANGENQSSALYGDTRVCNLGFDGGQFRCATGFEMDGTYMSFNRSRININKPGTFEYVSDSAKFQSFLIKDIYGSVLGVAFIQIKTV